MTQGTTPTFLFKFSVDLSLLKEWRICFAQDGKENLVKTEKDCQIDQNNVVFIKLTQDETLEFDTKKYIKLQAKALTNDDNVIPSDTKKLFILPILDKTVFVVENNTPTLIDSSTIEFEFDTDPCGFGLDFEELYIENVSGGGSSVSIQKIEQTTTSTQDNGINVITITLTDGTKTTFEVRNGSKGSTGEKGDKGDKGEDGADGKDYILTQSDKIEIANLVISLFPNGDEVAY